MTLNPTSPTASLLVVLSTLCIATLPSNAAIAQSDASTPSATPPLDTPATSEGLYGGGSSANWLEDDWEANEISTAEAVEDPEDERWNKTGLTLGFFGGLAQFDELSSGGAGVSLDDSFLGGASLGWDFGLIRFDVQGLLTGAEPGDGETSAFDIVGAGAGTVNLYVDVPVTRRFELYGGGGVGIGVVAVNFETAGDDELDVESGTGFVWTATAGLAFKASPGSTFTLGARFTDFEEVEFAEQTFDLDPVTSFEIGLRLTF